METNWVIISIVVVLGIVLIILLFRRNMKDKKDIEKFLNEDYKATPHEESEANDEER